MNDENAMIFHPLGGFGGRTDDDHERRMQRLGFALAYPFSVPAASYVFIGGYGAALLPGDTSLWLSPPADLPPQHRRACEALRAFDLASATAVLSAGSNASPTQLLRKFSRQGRDLPALTIPCLQIAVEGFVSCYARQLAPYGAIPTTITAEPGATTTFHVNFLSPALLERMNETEGLGTHYHLSAYGRIGEDAPAGLSGRTLHGYDGIAGHFPVRSAREACRGSRFPALDQRAIQQSVLDALGLDESVEAFILSNIYEDGHREAVLQALPDLAI